MPEPNTQKLEARRSIVTWVDILGYKNLLSAGDYETAYRASRIMSKFETEEFEGFGSKVAAHRQTFAVSDAIIRVVDADGFASKGAVFYELFDMAINQLNTVMNGVVVSGGMALGDVCLGTDEHPTPMGIPVGVAYQLDESRWEPSICVDSQILSAVIHDQSLRYNPIEEELSYTFSWIFSHEGYFFVNYLAAAAQDEGELLNALETHRALIVGNLADMSLPSQVQKKYHFLRDYHNAFLNWVLSEDDGSAMGAAFAFAD
ncbi:MAG: hypothetical protein AAFO91_10610, partial [Bacteroidota bacterium]